jgi:protein-disulfide isomerase
MPPEEAHTQQEHPYNNQANRPRKSKGASFQSTYGIPIAIVVAAALVATAIYFKDTNTPAGQTPDATTQTQQTPNVTTVPVQASDHIRGNPNAPIVLIEYSDLDCPFCKAFHETMKQLMDNYGSSGKVAWVYRHLPLEALHPDAPKLAEASECVTEQAGNDGFWKFIDQVFEGRGTNEETDMSKLPTYAANAGASDSNKFQLCLSSDKYKDKIAASIKEAVAANGGQKGLGTPFTLVFVGNQYIGPIQGAQPYSIVKQNIDRIITQLNSGTTTSP